MTVDLKQERKKNKMTQLQVAEKLHISESYYCLIENGKRNLTLKIAGMLAKLFKIKLECFLDDIPQSENTA